ncbi:MAG: hypothetical protein K2X82_29835 [Gemmataceae bacterium]|nr:hypothetical protein [Gemmataceae bacterium]
MSDDQVADDEVILRHIPGGTTFQAPGPRITSKNFELRPGEVGISVSRSGITPPEELMARIGDPAAGSRIAVATAAAVRALGLEVVPDPIPDDPGHALIRDGAASLTSQAVRKQLAVLFQFLPP